MGFEFGVISDLDCEIATMAFVLSIGFLIIFEFFTGYIEYIFESSPIYSKMLQKIYKELMMVGVGSFTIAMYQAANPSAAIKHGNWILAIDFASFLLFYMSLFSVAHSVFIMILSMQAARTYERHAALTVADTLQLIEKNNSNWFGNFLYQLRYVPYVGKVREQVEFKVIYALFRDTYWLPPDFNYGGYISNCFAQYSLKMITVGVSTWLFVVVLVVANFARIKLSAQDGFNCVDLYDRNPSNSTDTTNAFHRSLRSTSSSECSKLHLRFFFVCGMFVGIYILVLFFIGRIYELRLMAQAGVTDIGDYEEFLMFEESLQLKTEQGNGSEIGKSRKMSLRTFRTNVETLKSEHANSTDEHKLYRNISSALSKKGSIVDEDFWERLISRIMSFFCRGNKKPGDGFIFRQESDIDSNNSGSNNKISPTTTPTITPTKRSSILPEGSKGGDIRRGSIVTSKRSTILPGARRASSSSILANGGPLASMLNLGDEIPATMLQEENSATAIERYKMHKLSTQDSSSRFKSMLGIAIKHKANTKSGTMKITEDFSSIYFFRSPELYFRAVEVGVVFNCLYLAFWATNFITIVNKELEHKAIWQIIMLIPLLIICPCIGKIVQLASLLSAISELDLNVIGHVLEESQDQLDLIAELRTKITKRIKGVVADQKLVIARLFNEIDVDSSGGIRKFELRDMLRALHLHYSDEKFHRLFKAMDRNKDGDISLAELNRIIFPEEAQKLETEHRAELVQQHLNRKMTKLNRFQQNKALSDIAETENEETNSQRSASILQTFVMKNLSFRGNVTIEENEEKRREKGEETSEVVEFDRVL